MKIEKKMNGRIFEYENRKEDEREKKMQLYTVPQQTSLCNV